MWGESILPYLERVICRNCIIKNENPFPEQLTWKFVCENFTQQEADILISQMLPSQVTIQNSALRSISSMAVQEYLTDLQLKNCQLTSLKGIENC